MKAKTKKSFATLLVMLFLSVIVTVNNSASTMSWPFEWRGIEEEERFKFDINLYFSITKDIYGSKESRNLE